MTDDREVFQWGPYPTILADLLKRVEIEPNWTIHLRDIDFQRDTDHGRGAAGGYTLVINAWVADTYHPDRSMPISHYFPVPGSTYNENSWMRWIFECYTKVRLHECMEYFKIKNECDCRGITLTDPRIPEEKVPHRDNCASRTQPVRPYAPNHGPGEDPYLLRELTTDDARRTQFTGKLDHKR